MPEQQARDAGYRGLPNRCVGALTVAVAGIALAVAVASLAGSGGAARAVELVLFGVFIAGLVLIAATWIASRPRWLLPPSLRRSMAAGAEHGSPAVPRTTSPSCTWILRRGTPTPAPTSPYYLGPDPRDTAEQVFADARAHSADVDPVIGRPLGQPQLPGG